MKQRWAVWIIGFLIALITASPVEARRIGVQAEARGQGVVDAASKPVAAETEARPQVTLVAAHSTVSWDERHLDKGQFDLPLLYLHHEGAAAMEAERTLLVDIAGLAPGTEVELEATSWHTNVATGDRHRQRARFICSDLKEPACTVKWTLDADGMLSDLYRLILRDGDGRLLWENPDSDRPDLVALDTWDIAVDGYTVLVYYASLFPFVRGQENPGDRLPPAAVAEFIAQQFASLIAETWQTQFNTWGFGPIHPDWDADRVVEIIITAPPFALLGGTGIYTASYHADGSPYMERRLWWFASSPAYDVYDSLENGYRVILAHEFYHMVQWNTLLSAGCGMKVWNNLFLEAQAKFAPSVQYPEIEILGEHVAGAGSAYQSAARHLFSQRLNASYTELEADTVDRYDWAPYWRFLYEQLGGIEIARAALEEMACGYDPDLEAALPGVMDAALARVGGPFQSFEDSLVAFAEANCALRVQNGRCANEAFAACENRYYDPNHTYTAPSLEAELSYDGTPLSYAGSIPARFGIELVEVRLDRALDGQPLQIAVQGSGRFSVQVWQLSSGGTDAHRLALALHTNDRARQPGALTPHPTRLSQDEHGLYVQWIPRLETVKCDRLVLLIVRLSDQGLHSMGDYTVLLDATPDSVG